MSDLTAKIIEEINEVFQIDTPGYLDSQQLRILKNAIHRMESMEQRIETLTSSIDELSKGQYIHDVLKYHREQFPFEGGDIASGNRDKYYWLSGFLNDFLDHG